MIFSQEYTVEFKNHKIISNEANGEYYVEIPATTNFTKGVELKGVLAYKNDLGRFFVGEEIIAVSTPNITFKFGPYPIAKKFLPGNYLLSVFYSPMFQRKKFPKLEKLGFLDYEKKHAGILKVIPFSEEVETFTEIEKAYAHVAGKHPELYNKKIF